MTSFESSGVVFAASAASAAPEVRAGEMLSSSSSSYTVLEFIGEGSFGKIAMSLDLKTQEKVAVKFLKNNIQDAEREVAILSRISCLDPDRANLVRFYEVFSHMDRTCLVFEMLDVDLYDMLERQKWKPLSLVEIRPIAAQLMVALDALKSISVLHTDIKPENIMFVNTQELPLRVKIIDFGCALTASEVELGMRVQPTGYRAPEVALGLPFTEAIDIFGVGCILAYLYLAENLFPVDCEYQMMRCMVQVLGQPPDQQLQDGTYSWNYFVEEESGSKVSWRLMTPEEFTAVNHIEPKEHSSFIELPTSLKGLSHMYPHVDAAAYKDCKSFVSLLELLLRLDGDERVTPRQALDHPFITMSHLRHTKDYLSISRGAMRAAMSSENGLQSGASDSGSRRDMSSSTEVDTVTTASSSSFPRLSSFPPSPTLTPSSSFTHSSSFPFTSSFTFSSCFTPSPSSVVSSTIANTSSLGALPSAAPSAPRQPTAPSTPSAPTATSGPSASSALSSISVHLNTLKRRILKCLFSVFCCCCPPKDT